MWSEAKKKQRDGRFPLYTDTIGENNKSEHVGGSAKPWQHESLLVHHKGYET